MKMRCPLAENRSRSELWGLALEAATHLANIITTANSKGETPEQMWSGQKTDWTNLRVWGSRVKYIVEHRRSKVVDKTAEGIFVEYCRHPDTYRVRIPRTRKVVETRNVFFFEGKQQ